LLVSAAPAAAIPVFAHRYGLTCQACHTEVPHLNSFGEAFLANGYRIPGLMPKGVFPFAVRVQTEYNSSSSGDPDEGGGQGPLPKWIVDEIEVLTGGSIGNRGSYFAEAYIVDGGFPGSPRDVWAAYRATPDQAKIPLTIRAGQFTLPLPLDPETFRETTEPYAIWNQKAGLNPFDFFEVKIGSEFVFGDPARTGSLTAAVLQGHDSPGGFPAIGVDTMYSLERDFGSWQLNAYRYDGGRSLSGAAYGGSTTISGVYDRFWRNGFAAGWAQNRTQINAVYQIGNDSSADLYGSALVTSGAFIQARQAIGDRYFAVARWDATQGGGFARILTFGGGLRLSHNTRLTLFDTIQQVPGTAPNVVSSSFLIAY
jgi:hypothetical protein